MPDIRQAPSQLSVSAASLTQFKARFNEFANSERVRLREDLAVLAQLKSDDDSAVLIQNLETAAQAAAQAELDSLIASVLG